MIKSNERLIKSEDVFDDICDTLGIDKSEKLLSLEVKLEIGSLVVIKKELFAERVG